MNKTSRFYMIGIPQVPGCPRGVLVDGIEEFACKDVVIDSSQEKTFTDMPAGIGSMAVPFRLKIDEELLPPPVRIAFNKRRKMAQEAAARFIDDALWIGIGSHIGLEKSTWLL
ncbi:hypothetical protein SI65_08403 [Aspergillus cristatus]|uniref:Uncharacterized protein n=1 Tax=Aspergillus cristatus TaxID=573508 RepID=A0A1E3B4X3_ASPCR|nr:hypothetical protein SI65_10329 [Aspergillus cristatus]ODM15969.1 hypothetical protein SI65_08403 [Aspergillus cristatus]